MSIEQSTSQGEKRTESVQNMTLDRMVEIAYNTRSDETVRRLRLELMRRKANIPEGSTEPTIDQAFAIIDARYDQLLESLR